MPFSVPRPLKNRPFRFDDACHEVLLFPGPLNLVEWLLAESIEPRKILNIFAFGDTDLQPFLIRIDNPKEGDDGIASGNDLFEFNTDITGPRQCPA